MTRLLRTAGSAISLGWLVTCIAFAMPFYFVSYVYGIAERGVRSGYRASQDL